MVSGIMPISARIEMLKLRYFWKITHADKDNMAHTILDYTHKNLKDTKTGFAHEVFCIGKKLSCYMLEDCKNTEQYFVGALKLG